MNDTILEVEDLCLSIKNDGNVTPILHDVSFSLREHQRLGIVGNSGAGKSMTMYVLADLLPEKTTELTGNVRYHGKYDILKMQRKEKRKFCSENVAIILQDSIHALNPYRKIYSQLEENIRYHHKLGKVETKERIMEMMHNVGIPMDETRLDQYPGQFSGGMRQRISIAMALESNAKLLIADEPTTSLDVINQKRFLEFLQKICQERGLALLFISHNLGLVSMLCEDVLVMEKGRIIEEGTVSQVFSAPEKSYTQALVNGTRMLMQ